MHYASGYGTTAMLSRHRPYLLSVWGSDVYDFPNEGRIKRWLLRRNLRHATALASTSDGFVIAERDLELRGPGDFFGTRQSGLPRLRTGDLVRDRDVMEQAYGEARRLVAEGELTGDVLDFVQERWQQQFGLIEVG